MKWTADFRIFLFSYGSVRPMTGPGSGQVGTKPYLLLKRIVVLSWFYLESKSFGPGFGLDGPFSSS